MSNLPACLRTNKSHLATLGKSVWLLVLVRAHTEVLDSLTGVLLATEKDGVRAGRGTERKLVEREDLTASIKDALLRAASEAEGDDAQLRYGLQADVVRDGADNNDGFRLRIGCALSLLDDFGERDRWAVNLGLEETLQDDL